MPSRLTIVALILAIALAVTAYYSWETSPQGNNRGTLKPSNDRSASASGGGETLGHPAPERAPKGDDEPPLNASGVAAQHELANFAYGELARSLLAELGIDSEDNLDLMALDASTSSELFLAAQSVAIKRVVKAWGDASLMGMEPTITPDEYRAIRQSGQIGFFVPAMGQVFDPRNPESKLMDISGIMDEETIGLRDMCLNLLSNPNWRTAMAERAQSKWLPEHSVDEISTEVVPPGYQFDFYDQQGNLLGSQVHFLPGMMP